MKIKTNLTFGIKYFWITTLFVGVFFIINFLTINIASADCWGDYNVCYDNAVDDTEAEKCYETYGSCSDEPGDDTKTEECGANEYSYDGSCYCDDGFIENNDGDCVPEEKCPDGFVEDPDDLNSCIEVTGTDCSEFPGTISKNGECVPFDTDAPKKCQDWCQSAISGNYGSDVFSYCLQNCKGNYDDWMQDGNIEKDFSSMVSHYCAMVNVQGPGCCKALTDSIEIHNYAWDGVGRCVEKKYNSFAECMAVENNGRSCAKFEGASEAATTADTAEACSGKNINDDCAFLSLELVPEKQKSTGTCQKNPNTNRLECNGFGSGWGGKGSSCSSATECTSQFMCNISKGECFTPCEVQILGSGDSCTNNAFGNSDCCEGLECVNGSCQPDDSYLNFVKQNGFSCNACVAKVGPLIGVSASSAGNKCSTQATCGDGYYCDPSGTCMVDGFFSGTECKNNTDCSKLYGPEYECSGFIVKTCEKGAVTQTPEEKAAAQKDAAAKKAAAVTLSNILNNAKKNVAAANAALDSCGKNCSPEKIQAAKDANDAMVAAQTAFDEKIAEANAAYAKAFPETASNKGIGLNICANGMVALICADGGGGTPIVAGIGTGGYSGGGGGYSGGNYGSGGAYNPAKCGTGFSDVGGVCFPMNTGLSEASISQIAFSLFSWLMGLFTTLAVLAFVVSGIQYFMSSGDESMAESAKDNAKNAIVGIVVGLSGFIIVKAIAAALSGQSYFF